MVKASKRITLPGFRICIACGSVKLIGRFSSLGSRPRCYSCKSDLETRAARWRTTVFASRNEIKQSNDLYLEPFRKQIEERKRQQIEDTRISSERLGRSRKRVTTAVERRKIIDARAEEILKQERLREREYWLINGKAIEAEMRRRKVAIARRNGNRRRILLLSAVGSFTEAQFQALCIHYGNICLCCGEPKKLTRDHVISLVNGGSNDISNIQPLCGPCNSSKGAKSTDYRTFYREGKIYDIEDDPHR